MKEITDKVYGIIVLLPEDIELNDGHSYFNSEIKTGAYPNDRKGISFITHTTLKKESEYGWRTSRIDEINAFLPWRVAQLGNGFYPCNDGKKGFYISVTGTRTSEYKNPKREGYKGGINQFWHPDI